MPRTSTPSPAGTERLRAAPSFVQTATLDGRPYIAKEVEPYVQYWLSERYRVLLSMFGGRRGATVGEAIDGWFRLTRAARGAAERAKLLKAIADMRAAGVLMGSADDTSRYDARIVADYVAHRPFPRAVADRIVEAAGIGRGTRVVDLAGGPGDLALLLAEASDEVALMELSRGFLAAAARRARDRGVRLRTIHDSCNRLVWRDDVVDVATVAQALHWLDDVLVCRGLCRLLAPGGSFFVVHSAIELADEHPLAYLLGHDSILGRKPRRPFVDEVAPLLRRLALLFEALDAPDVQRIDPTQAWSAGAGQRIAPAGVALFRQRRPFGPGYARGFLTPQHIAVTGMAPDAFWADLAARVAAAPADALVGTHHWALLHFRRGADPAAVPPLDAVPVAEIAYEEAT